MIEKVKGLDNPQTQDKLDNIYTSDKYLNVSIIDILNWLKQQNCIPIPCQPRKKKPILDICQHKVLESGFEYGLFDTTYHDASKSRVEWINNYWNRWINIINSDSNLIDELNPTKVSIALNTGNGWNNNQFLSVIDIDNKDFIDIFNVDMFKDCPRVYGKAGVKLLFFSEGDKQQGVISNDKEHIIDLYFATSRLVFIYGEHLSSTKENPIYYNIDELKSIPTLKREDVIKTINDIVLKNDLTIKLEKEISERIKQIPKLNIYGKSKPSLTNMCNLRLSDVISFNSNLIDHPVHGATNGGNVSLNLSNDTWHCHRCHTGGGVIELIAVVEGIIDCSEALPHLFDFKTQKNIDKWLELKVVLENKYGIDVFKYDVDVRKWFNGNKKRISNLWDGDGNVK